MALSANEAIQQLLGNPSAFTTSQSLLGLVNQLSVEAFGKVTVLYSGSIGTDASGKAVSAGGVIKNLVEQNADIRVIDKTEAAKFIDSRDFRQAVERVTSSQLSDPGSAASDFLFNAKEGAWAKASENFIKATTGEVITWTPNASANRTFAQVEVPFALAEGSKITSINGRSLAVWQAEYVNEGKNAAALAKVFDGMNASSVELLLDSNIRVVTGAGGTVMSVDTGTFFQRWGASAPSGWLPTGSGESLNAMVTKGADASRWAVWKQGYALVQKIDDIPGAHLAGAVARRGLPFLGLALGALDANAAYNAGDIEGARRIMSDAAAETVLSAAGEIALGAVVTAGAVAVGLGALPAVVLGVVAGVVGGYVGGEAANRLMGYARQALADRGIDLGLGSPAPVTRPGQNGAVMDVSVDTGSLTPTPTNGLGGSQGGQGTLAAGPGYAVTANANFVDQGGLANTALSNVITNGTRPGDQNLSPTQGLLDSLRGQMNDVRDAWSGTKMTGTLVAGAGVPAGTAYSKVQTVTLFSTGASFAAEVFFASDGTMIGLTPQANFTVGAQTLIAGTRYVPSTISGPGETWTTGLDSLAPYQGSGILIYRQTSDALPYTDPLALDQNGNGVQLAPVPVSFDANADGLREALSWPISSDPLLVLDTNGDGAINNGRELIGLSDNTAALNLLRMDSNGDKRLTAADAIFAKLQIWGDQNLDGYAQTYERRSLAEAGIVAIDLDPAHIQTATVAGQSGVKGVVATYADGSTRTLWDLSLSSAAAATTPTTTQANYRPGVDKLTGASGSVLVANSAQSVLLDLNNSGAGQAMGRAGNDTLVGTAAEDWLIGGAGADKFQAGAGNDLLVIDADDKQADIDGGAGIDTALVADDRGVLLNLAQASVEVVYGGFGNDVFVGGGNDNYAISAASGDDVVIGGNVDDALDGDDGNDIVDGNKGDDLIRGGRGQDLLYGGDGNDVLDGGLDNDKVFGGAGGDVVVASGGRDTVEGGDGVDLIELHGNLEDYKFQASGANSNGTTAWVITDTKNSDGSAVGAGQVSNRDGVQQLRDIEKFGFKTGGVTTTLDLGAAYPLPVNDRVSVATGASSIAISAASLVANDVDFQSIANPQIRLTWVGDAVGGSVALSADKSTVMFTPGAGFSGAMEFAYTVQDKDAAPNAAPTVHLVNDPTQRGIMKAKVVLVPSDAPTDPDYAKQWYLGAIDAPAAWKAGYTGKGVTVLVMEPPGSYAVGKEVADLSGGDLKPNQAAGFMDTAAHSSHATAVAGVIGAARNGVGGVGVAYDATLSSISVGAPGDTLKQFGNDLKLMRGYDVVNNSWGYRDDPWNSPGSSPSRRNEQAIVGAAIADAAKSGRQGLGTVMVYSAGNERNKAEDSGLSPLTANPYTISVGAINRVADVGTGNATNNPFSERGANILVSAPGSSIQTDSTTLQTNDGNVLGSATSETQGTSFAAPIVSGVAALMLQANPALTYRDVQTILALTAKKDFGAGAVNGTSWVNNKADDWNGSGMHFSADVGFGMVDADAAVRMAESWVSEAGHLISTAVGANAAAGALADLGTQTMTFTVTSAVSVEQAMLSLKLDHTSWSDLVVKLTSPKGTTSVLLDRAGYQAGKIFATNPAGEITFDQDLMSTHFRGESAVGTWTLTVQDAAAGGVGSGTIQAALQVVGTDGQSWKHYTVTDEYTGGWSITQPTTQPSELNASAMSKSVRLDLSGGSSNVAGYGIALGSGLDRLVGGVANDTLIGSAGDEVLVGGGGNDSMTGGAGYDELQGGVGNDVMDGGAGTDLLVAGVGNDTLTGGADGDIFVVDANAASTTTIKDFNAAAGGDTLRIRSLVATPWANMTQTVAGGKLTIQAGTATVILEGVTTALSKKQLIGMANSDELPLDAAGHYATGNTIYVQPTGEAKYVAESVQFLGYATDPKSLGGNRSTLIGTLGSLSAYRVENVSPEHYDLVNVRWRAGTEGADNLLAGAALPAAPSHIDPLVWEGAIARMGRPVFLGKGGDDEITGSTRDEFLSGGADNDTLTGGKGNDYLSGGSGVDQFVFNVGDGQDTISAYAPTGDESNAGNYRDYDAYEREYRSQAAPTASAPVDASDVLVFHTSAGSLSVNKTFTSRTKDSFTAQTVLSYGAGDTVSFGATYTAGQLASASGIQLFNAQFDSGSPVSGLLDGRTITDAADAIDQAKYGSKTIAALGGNDLIFALTSNGLNIDAGSGDDTVYALEGSNTLQGGEGNDRIEVTAAVTVVGKDTLLGGQGNDTLLAGNAGAALYGDGDNDSLVGGNGADTLFGGIGGDTLRAGGSADSLYGEAGNDILSGSTGNDTLFGGADNDVLSGEDDSDELHGDAGDDNLTGGIGNDVLFGDAGNDVLIGGEGDDVLTGGADADYFDTGSGNDTLNVDLSSGNDTVSNATGVDVLRIAGVGAISSLGLTLIDNGVGAKVTWGTGNSMTYTSYNLDTQIWLDSNVKTTLRAVFSAKGLNPDMSFQFLSQYDLQQVGDTQLIGTLIGDSDADQLYGGPKGAAVETPAINGNRYGGDNAAYWYVLGGAGADSIAGGLSGAVLDGGGGNDSIRASNGVMVMRDTYHGGQDTLVMPEGMVPGTLRFFRIANPLQANSSDWIGSEELLGTSPKTALEQKLPTLLTASTSNSLVLPEAQTWNAQRYEGTTSEQHYDTLRVQSMDGKFTVDLVGYFESGIWKNNVANMLFTTVFDANGNSTSYSIDSLVVASSKDATYKWAVPAGIDAANASVYGGATLRVGSPATVAFTQRTEGRAVIGGEGGTRLTGQVKVIQEGTLRNPAYWGPYKTKASVIVQYGEYETYRNEAARRDAAYLGNGSYDSYSAILNGLPGNSTTQVDDPTLGLTSVSDVTSFTVNAIALPDYILGFGGDDTIAAGGTYVELHTSNGSFSHRTYASGGYSATGAGPFTDQVNGGGGNDTYAYSKGDGGLRIISIDEENAGAEGTDTLNLAWLASRDAKMTFYADGSGTVSVADGLFYGSALPVNSLIQIDSGRNGLLQVDKIVFSDKTVNVQDLLSGITPELSADGRAYGPNRLAYPVGVDSNSTDDRYWRLTTALPTTALLNGTPKDDIILVPYNGVVQGAEGADRYLVDSANTNFAVVMVDKGDSWAFGSNPATYRTQQLGSTGLFAGASSSDGKYLGKTESEWAAQGVLPLASSELRYWTGENGFGSTTYGKLVPSSSAATTYSLADWRKADGTFDDVTDELVYWQTLDASGKKVDHYVVLAGVLDAAGHDITTGALVSSSPDRTGLFLSQGSDYASGFGYNTLHALGGDDSVAAYANDYFGGGTYIGDNNTIYGESGNDSLDGGAGNDSLYGGADQDTLIGGFGQDYLDGGSGADLLIGGTGNDVYIVDGSDVINEEANSAYRIFVDANANPVFESTNPKLFDLAVWSSSIEYLLPGTTASHERDTIGNAEASYKISLSTLPTTSTTGATRTDFENSHAHVNDVFYTRYWRENLSQTFQSTTSSGMSPGYGWALTSSTFSSGTQLYTLVYQTIALHIDTLNFQVTSDDRGVDEVRGDLDLDLRDSRYANVENAKALGTTAHRLIGTSGDNVLTSNGAGSTLEGLQGNDVYYVFSDADKVIEAANAGQDSLFTVTNLYQLADNVEDLYSKGFGLTLKGNALNNRIVGDDQGNVLDGGSGADTLQGGKGDDSYVVSSSDDVLQEVVGEGRDTVWVSGRYTLAIPSTNDIEVMRANSDSGVYMKGNALGNQVIAGAAGDDTLDGGGGTGDSLSGGAGNDTYFVDNSSEAIIEAADAGTDTVNAQISWTLGDNIENLNLGNATLNGTGNGLKNVIVGSFYDNTILGLGGSDTISSGQGNDYLDGGTGNDLLDGGSGNDTLIGGDGNDTLQGSIGADSLQGGIGDDTYYWDSNDAPIVEAVGGGNDTLLLWQPGSLVLPDNIENATINFVSDEYDGTLTGNGLNNVLRSDGAMGWLFGMVGNDSLIGSNLSFDWLDGGDGVDYLEGRAGNDNLRGGAGFDTLDGGAGADTMVGGVGDDYYIVDNVGDVVTENANEGFDFIEASFNFALNAINVEGVGLSAGVATALNATGNAQNNELDGNEFNNVLTALGGNDSLWGNEGSDTLDGGAGADTMDGGVGDDYYVVDNVGDVVTEMANGGVDIIEAAFSYSLSANTNVEGLVMTYGVAAALNATGNTLNNELDGNEFNNQLTGLAGNDTLWGDGGSDTMVGGTGSDDYYVDRITDVVTENANEGTDTVFLYNFTGSIYTLGANLENLNGTNAYLNAGSSLTLTGNALNNVIVASDNAATNSLFGGDGNDVLAGSAKNDKLDGGLGDDELNGRVGADTMTGGAGDDYYYVDGTGDVVTEDLNQGHDVVESKISYTLGANVEDLVMSAGAAAALNATGNTLDNFIGGNEFDNTLNGGAGNDSLEDDVGGNDTLDGGVGVDTMYGGAGDDCYIVDNIGDAVIENSNEGFDIIDAPFNYTLVANNVECLVLRYGVAAALNATGNTLNNELDGNEFNNQLTGLAGNDTLWGDGGSDTMVGGTGSDDYYVDRITDVVTENANEGTDTVFLYNFTGSIYTLGANLENLNGTNAYLNAGSSLTLTGNALNNVIVASDNAATNNLFGGDGHDSLAGSSQNDKLDGGVGNDELNGRAGADTMTGGAGDDRYYVDSVGDVLTETANQGYDVVESRINYTLDANVEDLVLSNDVEATALTGTGNGQDNFVGGNRFNNVLNGGAGNDYLEDFYGGSDTLDGGSGGDTLWGGAGDDHYLVDSVDDVVTEEAGNGYDVVESRVNFMLGANVEELWLSMGSSAAYSGMGNALDNFISGNEYNNILNGGAGNDFLEDFYGGNDTLDGGVGADTLYGGAGADSYRFGRGWGIDTVQENDVTANVKDLVVLQGAVTQADVSFSQAGNNLEMLIGATGDKLLFTNWYLGNQYHVEEFRFTDGSVLTDSQAQGLVGAMAAFSATSADTSSSITTAQVRIGTVDLASNSVI